MIPVYNRITYLESTLRSVLSQDPGAEEMQIEVIDDASLEADPEPLVRRLGGDRVSFVRQPRNFGAFANCNKCIERARGEWVHILHSDDVVFSGFYARLKAALERNDDVGAAFCRHAFIDENERWIRTSELERTTPGILQDFIEKVGVSPRIQCPAIAVRRTVYEKLGGFREDLPYSGDWEMWKRIAVSYPFWYEPMTLAAYRVHSRSQTHVLMGSGETTADSRRCIAISHLLLPPDRAQDISRRARERIALKALRQARASVRTPALRRALKEVWQGLRCSRSPAVMKALLSLATWTARERMYRVYARARRQFARK
jgi:glycosyltransferase involved in cell wall biosynthesis